jgi:hypothetical protein
VCFRQKDIQWFRQEKMTEKSPERRNVVGERKNNTLYSWDTIESHYIVCFLYIFTIDFIELI